MKRARKAGVIVRHGDSRDVLRELGDASIDSVVTDPPYALVSIVKCFGGTKAAPAKDRDGLYRRASAGFMGQQWDNGETAFDPAFWREVLRVLKPGGHVLAFSGTRTYHRLACAIEDAGFEIRDMLGWLYGSGFPKSHDVSKGIIKAMPARRDDAAIWAGWGTALKPAQEPVVLARKPLAGTVAENVLAYGVGALNIDGCRIHADDALGGEYTIKRWKSGADLIRTGGGWKPDGEAESFRGNAKPGRWPANIIHDGSDEVLNFFAGTEEKSRPGGRSAGGDDYKAGATDRVYRGGWSGYSRSVIERNFDDAGSAARFFYTAKADAEDRWGSKHPTVKPVDLMAYMIRLVTPPGGLVLDPFAGSGTTGVAALREGCSALLIEREAAFVADIRERLAYRDGSAGHSLASRGRHQEEKKKAGADLPLLKMNKESAQP